MDKPTGRVSSRIQGTPKSTMDMDLINVAPREEERQHKLKRLVQAPKSFFMDVKSQCGNIPTICSHSQTPIYCTESGQLLALPTGGRVKLMEGDAFHELNSSACGQ